MTKEDKDQLVRRYITDLTPTGISVKQIGSRLFKENPGIWGTENAARKAVDYRIGADGESKRKHIRDKSLIKEISIDTNEVLRRIADVYTPQELSAIASGGRLMPGYSKVPVIDFNGTHYKIGGITDTHIGSKYFNRKRTEQAFEQFDKEGVDFVCHSGDVTEGMSNRPGQIYELDQLGYQRQRDEAIDVLGQWSGKMYLIDGNHDRWYIKSNGAMIVKDIAERLPDAEFLGHDEGDISLNGRTTIKLWHGEDSGSYAVSYRLQKVIESLSGGEKPNIMLFGHTHKSTYLFERNVHCYSLGCIESQSAWMRGKRISAHTGFWIIDVYVNSQGVSKCGGMFYPFYT